MVTSSRACAARWRWPPPCAAIQGLTNLEYLNLEAIRMLDAGR
jgi:hypothetical protein